MMTYPSFYTFNVEGSVALRGSLFTPQCREVTLRATQLFSTKTFPGSYVTLRKMEISYNWNYVRAQNKYSALAPQTVVNHGHIKNPGMSGFNVLYRHGGRGGKEDDQIELTAVRLDGGAGDMEDGESGSEAEGEGLAGPREDSKKLIEDEEIDENGVARDYEVALKHIGFGLFHVLLIAMNGVALLSDAVEVRTTCLTTSAQT